MEGYRIMGNIHLIPTDKLSNLCIDNSCGELIYFTPMGFSTKHTTCQHIYITNSEEIKEGDYVCASGGVRFVKTLNKDRAKTFKDDGIISKQSPSSSCHLSNYKKIILTTDQDLIKDGVQVIDDEFLEWFVKNSSCEWIEIIDDTFTVGEMSKLPFGTKNHKYKIIIPKSECNHELRQRAYYREGVFKCWGCGNVICEPKQSGLEYLISELRLEEFAGTENLPAVAEIIKEARIRNRDERWEFWNGGIHCTEEGGKSFLEFYKERVGK